MAQIAIGFPKGVVPIEYLASFATAFSENENMRGALLGMYDSFRQADSILLEPLGMFACLTAEEEAAAFLYYALRDKGYEVPNYGKLYRHADKVKLVIVGQVILNYFFGKTSIQLPGAVRVERDGDRPKTYLHFNVGEHVVVQEDPFETIITIGESESGHDVAVDETVDAVLAEVLPKGATVASHIKNISNRRNLCLYGAPERKSRFQSNTEMNHFKSNCIAMIVMGFLVFNGKDRTSSMEKLVKKTFEKINSVNA